MSNSILSLRPNETVKKLLTTLSNKRNKDVLEKRFGLKGHKKTLEAIGKEYGVTRERVRQIEEDALKHIVRPENYKEAEPLFNALEGNLRDLGEVAEEKTFFTNLVGDKYHPEIKFLLSIGNPFNYVGETDYHYPRWFLSREKLALSEKFLTEVASHLEERKTPVSFAGLSNIAQTASSTVFKDSVSAAALNSYLATSKLIKSNPFNEYGLIHWAVINPRGVRDKAHTVLARHSSPMHFREVAEAINKAGWSSRRAHPQTVHNELIKDKRFILVGRGMYALKSWGYEPGTVRDVMVSVLREARRPLPKEAIVTKVLGKRFVKGNTVLLNLQNKDFFKKTGEGHYTLA